MQQTQGQNFHHPRLSTSSYSSLSAATTALLNGLLPTHRFSQTSAGAPTSTTNPLQVLQRTTNRLKRTERIKRAGVIVVLTVGLAFLLLITVELTTRLLNSPPEEHLSNSGNSSLPANETYSTRATPPPIRAFFTCVWIFNSFLLVYCFIVHFIVTRRHSSRARTTAVFLREFGQIFDNRKSSSNNTLVDCLIKTCLLCLLWYSACYLILRSMAVLIPMQIIMVYSISVTARQFLGWIFLHEQFIGNKIIAYILGSSTLLLLAHANGFRLNTFLFSLAMLTCGVALKTIFDILANGFVTDLNSTSFRVLMINVCFCGTFLLWPLVVILHFSQAERLDYKHMRWSLIIPTSIAALTFNVLTIAVPFKYSSVANVAYLLLLIPSTSMIDRYLLEINYSTLVISAIVCAFASILLSMIPKQWLQPNEKTKPKPNFGLLHKDSTAVTNATATSGPAMSGGSSAFDEIRAQRRLRNALLHSEGKA